MTTEKQTISASTGAEESSALTNGSKQNLVHEETQQIDAGMQEHNTVPETFNQQNVNTVELQHSDGELSRGQPNGAWVGQMDVKSGGYLERILIPVFTGDKLKFSQWHADFTSFVNRTSL